MDHALAHPAVPLDLEEREMVRAKPEPEVYHPSKLAVDIGVVGKMWGVPGMLISAAAWLIYWYGANILLPSQMKIIGSSEADQNLVKTTALMLKRQEEMLERDKERPIIDQRQMFILEKVATTNERILNRLDEVLLQKGK